MKKYLLHGYFFPLYFCLIVFVWPTPTQRAAMKSFPVTMMTLEADRSPSVSLNLPSAMVVLTVKMPLMKTPNYVVSLRFSSILNISYC